MLQYLINATAIWLISLVLFDVFFRRESYHGYNRAYLLGTLLLGAILPTIQWQADGGIRNATLHPSVEQVISTKQNIANVAPDHITLSTQQWLMIVYAAGVLIAFVLLLIDIIKLVSLFRKGTKSIEDNWTVIETGKEHTPFSFRKILFVATKEAYTDAEWEMLFNHEKQHSNYGHFADLIIMQLSKIVFWFHPLVYIYNNRLLMVHEYQADNATAIQPKEYGHFLIEQSLLPSAPALSHSFNRSPIKNRIVMLTRKSTVIAKSKMLLFVPLTLVCVLYFSKISFSQKFERNGNMVTYRGNKFLMSDIQRDTIKMINPSTGKEDTRIVQKDPEPIKMNGETIYHENINIGSVVKYTGPDANIRVTLLKYVRPELEKLKDGMYTMNLSDIVVDEQGNIVYFNYEDMRRSRPQEEISDADKKAPLQATLHENRQIMVSVAGKPAEALHRTNNPGYYEDIDKDLQDAIYKKVCQFLNETKSYEPGKVDGKNVIVVTSPMFFWNHFKVKDHKIYDTNKDGEYVPL